MKTSRRKLLKQFRLEGRVCLTTAAFIMNFNCRFGRPSEVGGTVSFLVSEEASYITGETIVVAGGMHAKL